RSATSPPLVFSISGAFPTSQIDHSSLQTLPPKDTIQNMDWEPTQPHRRLIRTASFNIHSFRNADFVHTFDECILAIQPLNLDILAIQENYGKDTRRKIQKFAEAIGLPHIYQPEHTRCPLVILSRFPYLNVHRVDLGADDYEMRQALFVTVEVLQPVSENKVIIVFGCTHLTHTIEGIRIRQTEQLITAVKEYERCTQLQIDAMNAATTAKGQEPHTYYGGVVLAGDFNSLRLSDYTPADMLDITNHRKSSGWELPQNSVSSMMDSAGFLDTYRLSLANRMRLRYYQSLLAETCRQARGLSNTCWAGTRIDYVWLYNAAATARMWLINYQHVETNASDHYPVIADFQL
ncbi:hypothetical protein HDU76_004643, partial [Blyttiomyces sp. JEL0837]